MEEEDAFWMMCSIIEDLLPASYYSHTLIGIQVSTGKHVGNNKIFYTVIVDSLTNHLIIGIRQHAGLHNFWSSYLLVHLLIACDLNKPF